MLFGEVQRVIGQEAVADQDALIVVPQDLDDHLVAPASADAVERGVLVGEDPQPGRPAADLPAGLIDVLHGAVPGGLDQAVVAGLGQPPQAVAAADQRRRGDHQPGEGQQHRGALAVRGADAVLQVGGEPEQPRAELDGGGPQGVGGLLGVAALDPAEAGRAAGHRDAEAGDDRLGLGQVDLVLVVDGDRGVVQRGVALRAVGRQRDLDGAIDLLRRWGGSMAGRVPGLAPGRLGWGLGGPLEKGAACRLPALRDCSNSALSRSTSARNSSIWRACRRVRSRSSSILCNWPTACVILCTLREQRAVMRPCGGLPCEVRAGPRQTRSVGIPCITSSQVR